MKAVYPGSFDPITLGHADIIRRIRPFFDELTVLIAPNSRKSALFGVQERKRLIEQSLEDIPNVRVDIFEGLIVDYMRANQAQVIVRGLRAVTDFEYELVMANMNKKLSPDIETMIVFASPEFYYVSSNTVKEVARYGGSVKGLVTPAVEKAFKKLLPSQKKNVVQRSHPKKIQKKKR